MCLKQKIKSAKQILYEFAQLFSAIFSSYTFSNYEKCLWFIVNCEGDRLWDVKVTPMLQYYDGERWKGVCLGAGRYMPLAHVACRQQGYTNATSFSQL